MTREELIERMRARIEKWGPDDPHAQDLAALLEDAEPERPTAMQRALMASLDAELAPRAVEVIWEPVITEPVPGAVRVVFALSDESHGADTIPESFEVEAIVEEHSSTGLALVGVNEVVRRATERLIAVGASASKRYLTCPRCASIYAARERHGVSVVVFPIGSRGVFQCSVCEHVEDFR